MNTSSIELAVHPLAEMWPLVEGNEYAELVASVRAHGKILEPITLYEGKILDGRNRYRACVDAGIEPATVEFQGTDPVAFVHDKNLYRRHLTPGQRAWYVSQFTTFKPGDADTQRDVNQYTSSMMTRGQASQLAGVSEKTISEATLVRANGTAAEIESVKTGKASLKSVSKKIRTRNGARRTGSPARVPTGYDSLSAAVTAMLNLERNGMQKADVFKQIDIAHTTYRVARDVILLSELRDLSKRDLKSVKTALRLLDGEGSIQKCAELIKPIATKVWGSKGHRFKAGKNRSEEFHSSISFVLTACSATANIKIPYLNSSQRSEATANISEAIDALRKLNARLKEEN